MSETHEISLPDMLKDFHEKLVTCISDTDNLIQFQMGQICPCHSPKYWILCRLLGDCKFASTNLRNNVEESSVLFPLLDCVVRLLSKAERCLKDCMPTPCDADCVDSCKKVRELTKSCLEVSMRSTSKSNEQKLINLLMKVYNSPRVVLCDCQTHLNTLTLSSYLHMASSVVSSVIEPLMAEESSSLPKTKNHFLQQGSIHMAALRSTVDLAKQAIEDGQSVNRLDPYGNTPLLIAMILENVSMVEFLLENKADPCLANESGNTPLLLATITQNSHLVELLCSREANILATNSNGLSPLLLVLSLQDKELLEIMLGYHEFYISPVKVNKFDENKIIDQTKNIQDSPEQGPGSPGDLHEEIVPYEE